MSGRIVGGVLEHSLAENGARLVLVVLAEAARPDGVSWPSTLTIARRARLRVRTVQRMLRRLERSGEIEVRVGTRAGRSRRVYRVLMPGRTPLVDLDGLLPFTLDRPFTRDLFDDLAGQLADAQVLPFPGKSTPA